MKNVIFYWLDGTSNEVAVKDSGEPDNTLAKLAFQRLGFGAGALRSLDYYEITKD